MKIRILFALAITVSGCGRWSDRPGYGLRTFEIEMKSEDVGEMLGGAEQHLKRPAEVRIDGEEYRVKVNAAGSSTIREPKKSLTIEFEDEKWEGQREYRLATAIRDPSLIRSLLARDVFAAAGVASPAVEPVFVYLNDNVLGLYVGTEMINEDFFAKRQISASQWYEVKGASSTSSGGERREVYTFEAKPDPNLELILRVHSLLEIQNDTEFAARILQIMDEESVTSYLTAAQILNHWDGFNKNLFYVRSAQTGKLGIAAWDFDFTWYPKFRQDPLPWSSNELWLRMSNILSIRSEYRSRVSALKIGANSLPTLQTRIAEWREKIRGAYQADPFLGGLGYDLDHEAQALYDTIAAWYPKIP